MDDESKHSGRARVIIDSPMNLEMQQLSPMNGRGRVDNSPEIDNDNYYNEEDEEDES
jgi:hypothetical protein